MIKKLIASMLERRYYWRNIGFSEVAELYASRTLRMFAVSMVSIFVAIYLYQNGYDLTFIMLYFAAYFLVRTVVTVPAAYLIAWMGPKHATMLSNLLYVPALLQLVLLPAEGFPALVGFGILQAVSVALYDMSYLVNFSKVRVDEHVGKEIGYMHMFERIAAGLSPVIGGLVAFLFGPQATLILASIIFAFAAIPLLMSPEPVQRQQRISYAGVPWRKIRSGIVSELAVGFDFLMSGAAWSLFIALAIFGEMENSVYAKLGILSAVTLLAAIVTAKVFGQIVDRRRGRELLYFGVILDMVTHILRGFIATPVGVVVINILNEIATSGYAMPFTKGLFDMADRLPGFRIVYMSIMSMAAALGAALCALIVAGLSLVLNEVQSLQVGFIVTAVAVFLITKNGFPVLTKREN